MKYFAVIALLIALVLVPFAIWGSWFELTLNGDKAIEWLQKFGFWSAIVGVLALIADLFLPLPASGLMAALGVVFGPLLGGMLAALGNFLAGALAYWLCRCLGRPALDRIVGDSGRLEHFERSGFIVIAGSRALPILPEVTACMAGLYNMPWPRFAAALALGAIVTGFGFAFMGHQGRDDPTVAIIVATALPPILLLIALRVWPQVPRIES